MVSWPENDITLDGWLVSTSSFCSKMMQKKIITATRAATLCRRCHLKPDREGEPQFRVPANTPACPISVQLLTMMFYHFFTASLKLDQHRNIPYISMTRTTKNGDWCDVYFEFLFWPTFHRITLRGGVSDPHGSPLPGREQDAWLYFGEFSCFPSL